VEALSGTFSSMAALLVQDSRWSCSASAAIVLLHSVAALRFLNFFLIMHKVAFFPFRFIIINCEKRKM
jgi:hypothetical protein